MGKSGEMYLEQQEVALPHEMFVWLTDQEWEELVINKYGHGLAKTIAMFDPNTVIEERYEQKT